VGNENLAYQRDFSFHTPRCRHRGHVVRHRNTGVQNPSTAQVELGKDGSVVLYTGCADIGQGSSTVLCQIAAEVLGLSPGEIRAVAADTKYTTNAGATSASRQTYISGNAVRDAAWKLADVLLTEGVELLKVPKEALSLDGGFVVYTQDPEKRISLARLADRVHRKRIPLRWAGYFDPATVPLNPETGEGVPYATYAYACHLALVTVDTLTGDVEVNRVVAAHDVGRAVHPAGVIGQICGGVAMGVGFALMEEYVPGKTESMKDYPIPTCKDMPEVLPLIVESPEPTGPFGAKGVGEPALIPTAPAVMNALSDALGKRLYALPAHPEKVLKAIGRFG
jgi:CO/xanthine dehydrogenase Mo-binding subunit